jgi:hypothetical protein
MSQPASDQNEPSKMRKILNEIWMKTLTPAALMQK